MGVIEKAGSRILSLVPGSPALGAVADVHAAVVDNGAPQVVVAGITNPPVPRTITVTAGGTAGDIKPIKVKVEGTNAAGEAISEEIGPFTENTAGTKEGAKAFKTVTKVTILAHDGEGATTSVGSGKKLGLGVKLGRNTVLRAFLAGVLEAVAPTVAFNANAVESNTVELNSALNGTEVRIDYYTTAG